MVLGSEINGPCNVQKLWIWGFGTITADNGTWMDDCELFFDWKNLHELAYAYIHKLNEFTGFMQRLSLSSGLKNKTVFTMKQTGFLLSFSPRQSHGDSTWHFLHRGHWRGMRPTHHIKSMHENSLQIVQRRHCPKLQILHWIWYWINLSLHIPLSATCFRSGSDCFVVGIVNVCWQCHNWHNVCHLFWI